MSTLISSIRSADRATVITAHLSTYLTADIATDQSSLVSSIRSADRATVVTAHLSAYQSTISKAIRPAVITTNL